jgi:hypothetical protein
LVSEKLFFLCGRDSRFTFFTGSMAYVRVNVGIGSFTESKDFTSEKDGK